MGVPHKHSEVFVPADRSNLHHLQSLFKKPGDCFVTQIMKMEVNQACGFHHPRPAAFDGIDADREHPSVNGSWQVLE